MRITRRKKRPHSTSYFVRKEMYRIILTPEDGGKAYQCTSFPALGPNPGDTELDDLNDFDALMVELKLMRPARGRMVHGMPGSPLTAGGRAMEPQRRYIAPNHATHPYGTTWPVLR